MTVTVMTEEFRGSVILPMDSFPQLLSHRL